MLKFLKWLNRLAGLRISDYYFYRWLDKSRSEEERSIYLERYLVLTDAT